MAAATLVGVVAAGTAHADVYRFVDARGVMHFTNVPTDARFELLHRTPSQTPARRDPVPRYDAVVAAAAREHKLDQALLHAVIAVESGYDPQVVSQAGAAGLMQLMPATARRYGVTDPLDPLQNVHGGARYLRDLMQRFDGDLSLVLAAYNAGEGAVARHGNRIPPYGETRRYVSRVLDLYQRNRRVIP